MKDNNACVIECNPQLQLAGGYTRVKVMPKNYADLVTIAGMTGKTLQDVVDELLTYAISHTKIKQCNGVLHDYGANLTGGDQA